MNRAWGLTNLSAKNRTPWKCLKRLPPPSLQIVLSGEITNGNNIISIPKLVVEAVLIHVRQQIPDFIRF